MRTNPLYSVKKVVVEQEISPYAKNLVALYAEGRTTEEIGLKLNAGKKTVERHIQLIRKDYDARNIAHLVAIFLRTKIIE